jgi:hypothetical protein
VRLEGYKQKQVCDLEFSTRLISRGLCWVGGAAAVVLISPAGACTARSLIARPVAQQGATVPRASAWKWACLAVLEVLEDVGFATALS